MMNLEANSIVCTDSKVQQKIAGLNWDLSKSGCENLLIYFNKPCPKPPKNLKHLLKAITLNQIVILRVILSTWKEN